MKMLMLTEPDTPFMLSDLLADEVLLSHSVGHVYPLIICDLTVYLLYQVTLINAAIDWAKPGSKLYRLDHVSDPSDDMVEVLIMFMEWNMLSRQRGIRSEGSEGLTALHQSAVDLLELLKSNLPDKCGEKEG
jgi:hypothetical protein